MKLSGILACLAFSIAVALSLEPWSPGKISTSAFEIHAESEQSGIVQLYYDTGRGMNEPDSSIQAIAAGKPATLRFAIPYGRFRALRFDPLDRDTRMVLSGARIIDGSGRTLVSFSPGQFRPQYQIDSLKVLDGKAYVVTTPGGGDPQLALRLEAPFEIPKPTLWGLAAEIFPVLVACLFLAEWAAPRLRPRARALWDLARSSPTRAIAAVALAGTVAANYPVVFAGRSLITPSFGVALLYGQNPWIPGSQGTEVGIANKADVGALLWHHLPLSMIERRATVGFGELPLWNRYDSAGSPLLGQGQSLFGDPLNLLPMLADGATWAWDLKFILAKWVFACGAGLCVWRMFRHVPASLLLAASVPFIGFFVYRINHPAIFSLCYAPWILYCWIRCVEGRSARAAILWMAALIGANWSEMNSGTVKEAYVLLLFMNFTGACILLMADRPAREKARLLCGLLAAGAVFAMVGSPVWLTFARALRQSYTSYNDPMAFQIQPGMFVALFDEAFFRPFQIESGVINPSANFFVLLGLLWAVVRWRALAADRFASALALASLPALALAFGVIPPGFIAVVPFLGNIHHVDNTFSCGLIVVFALLSGFGWSEAWKRMGTGEGRREAGAVLVLLLLLGACFLGTAQAVLRSGYSEQTWGRLVAVDPFIYAYGVSLAVGALLLTGALYAARSRGTATGATLVYAVLGFAALHWRMGLQLGRAYPEYVVHPTHRVNLQAESPTIAGLLADRAEPFRVAGLGGDFLPGWSGVYDLEGISGPDALVNPYYREFMDAAGIERVWDWRYLVEAAGVAQARPIFDLLNVRYYLGYHQDRKLAEQSLKLVRSADMDTFESPSVWPRAFFTDSVAVYGDLAQYCSWIRAGDGRPFAAMQHSDWVKLSPLPLVSGDLSTRRVNPAGDYRLTTNTTSFTVSASGPGFIVVTEAYEEGNFRVTVNGTDAPCLRLNHAFKGVYVDSAGVYNVRFSYWPRGFSMTLALFGAGLALILLSLFVAMYVPAADRNSPARKHL